MATNLTYDECRFIPNIAATSPATPTSGDPVLVGQIPGIALTDEGDGGNDAGNITVDTEGVYSLSVKGENNAGNSAVAFGDKLYYEAGQTPPINKDNVAGVFFGYAWGVVTSGATATINVKVGE